MINFFHDWIDECRAIDETGAILQCSVDQIL